MRSLRHHSSRSGNATRLFHAAMAVAAIACNSPATSTNEGPTSAECTEGGCARCLGDECNDDGNGSSTGTAVSIAATHGGGGSTIAVGGAGGDSSNDSGNASSSGGTHGEDAPCQVVGCPVGQTCLETGACIVVDDPIEFSVGGGSGGGGAPSCVDVQVSYEAVIPTVALLIDRSSSMMGTTGDYMADVEAEITQGTYEPWGCPTDPQAPPGDPDQLNYGWRWNVVRNVLFNPLSGVLPAFQSEVRFGMTLFTHQPAVDPDLCPELIVADFALGNATQLMNTMQCHDVGRFTPTLDSLAAAAQGLHDLDVDGPKLLILATDGAPTTCACTDFKDESTTPEECRPTSTVVTGPSEFTPQELAFYEVVQEAGRIHDEWGIQISVIDVSSEDQTYLHNHLQEVATAGGGRLYDGLRPTGLSNAFFSSVQEVRSCEIDLDGEIVTGFEDQGTVTLDDEVLELVASGNGYRVVSPSRIELLGQPCRTLKEGSHELSITFPCDTFVVIR